MKELLVKDYRILMTQKKSFFIILIIGFIMLFIGEFDKSFLVGYMMMIAMILSASTINYDESDHGMAFIMTLPVSRKTYAVEKYVFTFINIVLCGCALFILYLITKGFIDWQFQTEKMVSITAGWIGGIMLAASTMLPVYLKFGAEKRRVVLMILWVIVALAAIGGSKLLEIVVSEEGRRAIIDFVEKIATLYPAVLVVAMIALLTGAVVISVGISIRIMQKKEF